MDRRRFVTSVISLAAGSLTALGARPVLAANLAHKDIGIIMMHGKLMHLPGPLVPYLEREGYLVSGPEMPWSATRRYDVPYSVALRQVHREVEKLRSRGARMVVVGGESFGANGALAYQAEYGDADALVLLAPGHMPGSWYRKGITKDEVDRATVLLAEGKGKESFSFLDPTPNRPMHATVETYLSYFRPRGSGNVALSARQIAAKKKPIPVLVVNSNQESRTQGRETIYDELLPHPKSVYIESAADHSNTAEGTRPDVARFLDSIAQGFPE